jgi:hypothetical protein
MVMACPAGVDCEGGVAGEWKAQDHRLLEFYVWREKPAAWLQILP